MIVNSSLFEKRKEGREPRNFKALFFIEAAIFFPTFFLGFFTTLRISYILKTQNITSQPITIPEFLLYFSISTFFILLLIWFIKKRRKSNILFRGVFILAFFWGEMITLSAFLGDFLSLILTIFSIIIWIKKPFVIIHNLFFVLSSAGIAAVLGLRIQPETIIILLLIFAVYDFIAVYKTKHMQKMAKAMIKASAPLAFVISLNITSLLNEAVNFEDKKERNTFFLGGGDIIFPLTLSFSLISQNVLYSFFVAIFSFFGLSFSFYIFLFKRKKKPIPALPPIALFTLIGFFIGKIIF